MKLNFMPYQTIENAKKQKALRLNKWKQKIQP